jgi:hypothetical protein
MHNGTAEEAMVVKIVWLQGLKLGGVASTGRAVSCLWLVLMVGLGVRLWSLLISASTVGVSVTANTLTKSSLFQKHARP